MELKDILSAKYRAMSAQEYLEKKREDHREEYTLLCNRVRAQKDNAAFRDPILRRADEAMKNLFILPGTGGKLFDVGTPPAWKECRGDSEEYLWVLARMGWLADLADAYLLTGEESYAEKAFSDVLNFIETCPPPDPYRALNDPSYRTEEFCRLTPWRQLEVSMRMFDSWKKLYEKLLLSPVMTAQIHERIVCSLYEHCLQIALVSPVLWPRGNHNHYLHEMLGLLSAVSLFPEYDVADSWRACAVSGLELSILRQFGEDGAQLEGCPGYHNLCASMLLAALRSAKAAGAKLSETFRDRLGAILLYSAMILRPDGDISTIGDSPKCERFSGEIAYGYFAASGSFGPFAPAVGLLRAPDPAKDPITEEDLRRALAECRPEGNVLVHFPSVGQIYGRTGFGKGDSWFSFLCHTPVFNGHSHIDPLSVELILKGREVLLDPSYFTYAEIPERRIFKSATYHCCLTFGEREPFDYIAQWTYTPQKPGSTAGAYRGEDFLAGDGSHENYAPAEHRRLVLLLGGESMILIDDVKDPAREPVDLWFHTPLTDLTLGKTSAESRSSGVRILYPAGCTPSLLPSRRSYDHDIAEPSMRIRLNDPSPSSSPLYVTAFTLDPALRSVSAKREDDRVILTADFSGKIRRFCWIYGKSLTEI